MKNILTVCALVFSTVVSANSLNNVVVFGDSLSDNGNLYEYMKRQLPVSPPYYEGRFSNGPVWIELVTAAYYPQDAAAHMLDYAFGGAGIIADEDPDEIVFTLKREIDTYLFSHQDKADPNSLFVIWIGSNNYLRLPEDFDQAIAEVNDGISKGIKKLIEKGAKNFLVVNLPDLGRIPAALDFDAVDRLTSFTERNNEVLRKNITDFETQYPDVHWVYLDVNSKFTDLMDFPEKYGFTNTTGTCYEQMMDDLSPNAVLKMSALAQPEAKQDACNGYVFFDPVHPAALTHRILAENAIELLNASGITFE